jgi:two-component system response regulator RegA
LKPSVHPPQLLALIVDDDDVFRTQLRRALEKRSWTVREASDGSRAIEAAAAQTPALAIVDLRLPGMTGLEIVQRLRALSETTAIIVLTGYGSIPTALSAMRVGANDLLTKPADADQIMAAYRKITSASGNSDQGLEDPAVPSLARVEWEHIHRVLDDCNGNISQAAKRLGLYRRSLQRKLSKYPPRE